MRQEIKDLCDALRSGFYKQGKSRLCTNIGNKLSFCCLGVAHEVIVVPDGSFVRSREDAFSSMERYRVTGKELYGEGSVLHEVLAKFLNMDRNGRFKLTEENPYNAKISQVVSGNAAGWGPSHGVSLSSLNDYGFSFKEIADVIEYVETNNLWMQYNG